MSEMKIGNTYLIEQGTEKRVLEVRVISKYTDESNRNHYKLHYTDAKFRSWINGSEINKIIKCLNDKELIEEKL